VAVEANEHLRFRRTRVVIADGELVKPLLGFEVTSEGGLMAFLARGAPVSTFRYGVLDVPAGRRVQLAERGIERRRDSLVVPQPPLTLRHPHSPEQGSPIGTAL
jgi:hypothetical protein